MVIYTYGHQYPVTSVFESNDKYDVYICSDEETGGLCRVLRLKDKSEIPELVAWLSEQVDPEVFTDYKEHFMFDNSLCIVMKYTQGITLADKSDTEAAPLRERLELFRKILERAVLLDIPDYFLDKCFDEKNIIVAPDMTLSFNYPIEDITGQRECAPVKRAEQFFKTVFAREIERKVPDELIEFYKEMSELGGAGMIELYSRYYMMMTALIERNAGNEEPKSIWYKLWDKIKKVWKVLKKVLIIALLAAAVAYLVFAIKKSKSSENEEPNFDSIGTVTIDKDK
ncbi:hypothetical protein [Ruminococcus sp. NK3A76]|uniref:hypothetical protein n=1 Tax=Ruminococcus sp. NK3A76 TaxID=877411 RepID=UPI0004902975|nr:hypothetical protein [Ruminococcus sp. NK3A76]